MGILDFLGGLGSSTAAPWAQRLTSGMGRQGGVLSMMGLGDYGGGQKFGPPAPGQTARLANFQQGLQQMTGGDQTTPMAPMPNLLPQGGGGGQGPGLSDLVAQYLKMNQRQ